MLYDTWLGIGENYKDFWDMTFSEINKVIIGYNNRLKLNRQDIYTQSRLILLAFNAPEKFPNFNSVWEYDSVEDSSTEDDIRKEITEMNLQNYFMNKKHFVIQKRV